MKLGIGGVVTFKNGKIDQFLNEIPIEHLVLETDAPYLAPAPFRGKEMKVVIYPTFVKSGIRLWIPYEKVASITTENAKAVLNYEERKS